MITFFEAACWPEWHDTSRFLATTQWTARANLFFPSLDYSLNNPDTLTKYKTAGTISEKVLAEVSKLIVPGEKIVTICEKGDKLLEEEVSKVYAKTKFKGQSHQKPAARSRGLSRWSSSSRASSRFCPPDDCLPCRFCHALHSSLFR